jgi:ornithine cyclodeaminase/alanine dehydrogenase-like protein (mu-crystallin family)
MSFRYRLFTGESILTKSRMHSYTYVKADIISPCAHALDNDLEPKWLNEKELIDTIKAHYADEAKHQLHNALLIHAETIGEEQTN